MRICKLPRNILNRLDSRQFSVYRKISPDETRSPFADFSKIQYVYATQTQTFYSNILDKVRNKKHFYSWKSVLFNLFQFFLHKFNFSNLGFGSKWNGREASFAELDKNEITAVRVEREKQIWYLMKEFRMHHDPNLDKFKFPVKYEFTISLPKTSKSIHNFVKNLPGYEEDESSKNFRKDLGKLA